MTGINRPGSRSKCCVCLVTVNEPQGFNLLTYQMKLSGLFPVQRAYNHANLEGWDEGKVGRKFKKEGTYLGQFMLIDGRNQHTIL